LSIIAFWGFTQDISLSTGVIQASIETKSDIVFGLISWQLLVYILLIILIMVLLTKQYRRIEISKLNYVFIIFAVLSFLTFFIVESKRAGTFKNRLPYTLYFESKKLYQKNKLSFKEINHDLKNNQDSIQLIFVLGESVRADHLPFNGYARQTMPLLSQQKNLISFPQTFTTNTYTGISVPQILSSASVFDDYKNPKYSLIQVLNKTGIPTYWIGNQTPENSYLPFIQDSNHKFYIDPTHSEFSFNKELDEKILPIFKRELKTQTSQFFVLHMMGSHWWYENRYDERFRKFKPVIKTKFIPSNSEAEMINSYDNTILYLDFFLNQTINELENKNKTALLIYLSDHGELLGENGKWLHAQPGDEKSIRSPALIIWYSDKFQKRFPDKIDNLKQNQNKYLPLDFFYHTILDVYEINDADYNKDLSIFQKFKFHHP
jgi:glucan phosphoethanolaminetransferase (alkaline phosphatase superfamily)